MMGVGKIFASWNHFCFFFFFCLSVYKSSAREEEQHICYCQSKATAGSVPRRAKSDGLVVSLSQSSTWFCEVCVFRGASRRPGYCCGRRRKSRFDWYICSYYERMIFADTACLKEASLRRSLSSRTWGMKISRVYLLFLPWDVEWMGRGLRSEISPASLGYFFFISRSLTFLVFSFFLSIFFT